MGKTSKFKDPKYGIFLYPEEKIGVKSILRGIWIVITVLGSVGHLIKGGGGWAYFVFNFLSGIIWIPLVNLKIKEKTGHELSSGLRFVIMILMLSVLGIVGMFSTLGSDQGTTTLITKSLDDMLPVRSDIATEFTIGKIKDVNLTAAGFESGKKLSATKRENTMGVIVVEYAIYKFSTIDYAKSYYDSIVDKTKETGGYKEISIYHCFAYRKDYGLQANFGESICQRNNIVYSAYITSQYTLESVDDHLRDATKLLGSKVG